MQDTIVPFRRLAVCAVMLMLPLLAGCNQQETAASDLDSIHAQGAALDERLADAYLHKDRLALSAIVAPDYYASGNGFEWNRADLEREFPKIALQDFHIERQRVKQLSPGVLLVTDVATVREIYDGQDVSGRYLSADVWVLRDAKWLLLVEQEVPLK